MKFILGFFVLSSITFAGTGATFQGQDPEDFISQFEHQEPAKRNLGPSGAYFLSGERDEEPVSPDTPSTPDTPDAPKPKPKKPKSCYAYTWCQPLFGPGYQISCYAKGTKTCSYQYVQNRFVSCAAYNEDGTYQTYYRSCYYGFY